MADRDDIREHLYLRFIGRLLSGDDRLGVSEDEVAYFRAHPEEIDDFSAPIAIHRVFLLTGIGAGATVATLARVVEAAGLLDVLPALVARIAIDLAFGVGVALIGASITAYFLGTLMNQQQRNAHRWRAELHARIAEQAAGSAAGDVPPAGAPGDDGHG